MKPIKLAMADDEQLFLNGLKSILEKNVSLQILFTAENGRELIEKLQQSEEKPDIVLLDLRMKDMDGVETSGHLREIDPEIRIVMLSSHYRDSFLGYMLKLGVNAFLPKNISPDKLAKALKRVHQKGLYFDENQLMNIHGELSSGKKPLSPSSKDSDELTPREREVLQLICEQYTNAEIADKLVISIRTVEGHRNNLLIKTGVRNTVGLVLYAFHHQLINWEERMLKFSLA